MIDDKLCARAYCAFCLLTLVITPAASQVVPRLENAPCDYPLPAGIPTDINRECGYLIVAANRALQGAKTYRLAVVTYRARDPNGAVPLLLLHGGPGGIGGTRFPWSELRVLPFTRHRDVITFDMRGVSASEPAICPRFVEDAAPAFRLSTRREWEAGWRRAIVQCVASLEAQGIDRAMFGADVNAADAIDLRRALGYERWDIYGVSYGGIVVQELLRLDSAAVNAAAIVSSPSQGDDYAAQGALRYQRNLERVFTACTAQPGCHAAFPTLEQDFYALFDEFTRKPVLVAGVGEPPQDILLNGERFLMELRREIGPPQTRRRVPLLIHELRHGDRASAMRRLLSGRALQPWDALGRLVQCNEYGAGYRAAVARFLPQMREPFRSVADDFREHCDLWLRNPARQADSTRVASNVPTLILHGEYDGDDGPAVQKRIAAKLTRAYTYTFPGEGHAGPPVGCHGDIVQQFFTNPERVPNGSCVALMLTTQFRAQGFGPALTVLIQTTGNATSGFAGTWEAAIATPPDLVIRLETDGNAVSGMVFDQMLPILDGTITSDTLRFIVKTADAARLIRFQATRHGDELRFTRTAENIAGVGTSGVGMRGVFGPSSFAAKRVR